MKVSVEFRLLCACATWSSDAQSSGEISRFAADVRDWEGFVDLAIRSEATKIGPDAGTLIDVILRSRPHPEQGFRSAIGILGLVKRYGPERVDAA